MNLQMRPEVSVLNPESRTPYVLSLLLLFVSMFRRDQIWFFLQEHSQSSSSFPKLPGPGSPMRSFSTFLVLFTVVAVNFPLLLPPFSALHFVLFFFFWCWRMSCPPTVQTNLLCWGSLLRQGPIFNQMFCKQKEYSFSRTLLTRTFLWLSLLGDFISVGISVSPKRVQTADGLHSISALLLLSLLRIQEKQKSWAWGWQGWWQIVSHCAVASFHAVTPTPSLTSSCTKLLLLLTAATS